MTLLYWPLTPQHSFSRYCLDRAHVIYDDDVAWFCEDCDIKIAEPSSRLPCGTDVSVEPSDDNTSLDHDQTECHKNCENDSKSEGECGPNLQDTANSKEKSGSVQISRVAISEDLNMLQLECQAEAQPIADPIWR